MEEKISARIYVVASMSLNLNNEYETCKDLYSRKKEISTFSSNYNSFAEVP